MDEKIHAQIEALLAGETKQLSLRAPIAVLDLMKKCGKLVYGPMPEKGSSTTFALYFLCFGLLRFMEEKRKEGAPVIDIDIDPKGVELKQRKKSG